MVTKTKVKAKEKQISEKFFEAADKFKKQDKVDLIEYLDEIDHLGSVDCTEGGGFRVPDAPQGEKIFTDWEDTVTKILESVGFKVGDWEGELEEMGRTIAASANGKTIQLAY
jgi:hypothetical protein